MGVMAGYKQTEVGVIPEDWDTDRFCNLYLEPSRNGIYKKAEFQGKGIRIVNMGEMFGYEFISNQEMNLVELTRKEIISHTLKDGDLLFGRRSVVPSGAGKCSLVVNLKESVTFESSIIRVRLNQHKVHPLFYYYYFASPTGRFVISTIVSGTNIKGVRASELKELNIPVPTKAEQEAIAKALSDVDALIESLERLIDKKRLIKQGAMQELLRPKEGWILKRLEDICSISNVRFDPVSSDIERKCIELENLSSGNGRLLHYTSTKNLRSQKAVFYKDDVLFGKLRPYLRKYWHATFDGVCSTEIWVIKANEGIDSCWLYCIVQSDYVINAANKSTGTKMPRAEWDTVKKTEVYIPQTISIQKEIAKIISDIDAEIEALETKLAKYRMIKQGMMNELLTGRIRLV